MAWAARRSAAAEGVCGAAARVTVEGAAVGKADHVGGARIHGRAQLPDAVVRAGPGPARGEEKQT